MTAGLGCETAVVLKFRPALPIELAKIITASREP